MGPSAKYRPHQNCRAQWKRRIGRRHRKTLTARRKTSQKKHRLLKTMHFPNKSVSTSRTKMMPTRQRLMRKDNTVWDRLGKAQEGEYGQEQSMWGLESESDHGDGEEETERQAAKNRSEYTPIRSSPNREGKEKTHRTNKPIRTNYFRQRKKTHPPNNAERLRIHRRQRLRK